MLKLDLFKSRNFAVGNVETLALYGGLSALFFFLVLYLQQVAGYSPVAAGASNAYALWGELMSTRARMLGAGGVVLDGYVRDSHAIREMKFPCFARGTCAQDQRGRGRVIAFRTPVEIGQARVETGDIVFGDSDGVLVVPRRVETDVVTRALEKVQGQTTEKIGEEKKQKKDYESFLEKLNVQ